VPGWAIALLVLVCILLLLSILTCLLYLHMNVHEYIYCDLSKYIEACVHVWHPMSEYLHYQSHGRYVSPSSKPNPYSQVSA
ncbi:Mucin-1, partial [Nestor notabilis]